MHIVRILVAAVFPIALLGCPDKSGDTKPDPAASASAAAKAAGTAAAATGASSAAPATSGGGW